MSVLAHSSRCGAQWLRATVTRVPCRGKYTLGSATPEPPEIQDVDSRDHWVVAADAGRTLVLFHPERPFPYAHSLPVPRQEALLREGDSALKVQFRLDVFETDLAKNKLAITKKLAQTFFTTPQTQAARSERRHTMKNPPKRREGI